MVDSFAAVARPTLHLVQEVRPVAFVKNPAGQPRHWVSLPSLLLYLPGTHGKQNAWPGLSWYEPLRHCVHVAFPLALYVPAGHTLQVIEPDTLLYLPAVQGMM